MSHYPQPPYPAPSPYAGPTAGYFPPPAAVPSSARRAGTLMVVLGLVVLLLGACFVGISALLPTVAAQSPQRVEDLRAKMQLPADISMSLVLGVGGAVVAVPGLALLGLAVPVRRGRRWAVIATLVVTSLVLLWLVVNLIVGVVGLFLGSLANLPGVFVAAVAGGAFGLLLAWLIGALRGGAGAVDPYQQYLSQYYYHQQAAQAYAAGRPDEGGYGQGGGYGFPAPPPPTSSAAPPPPTQSG